MSKYVFIMGAGCSADSGVPLMNSFLERAEDIARSGLALKFQNDYDMTLKGRSELMRTHSKSQSIDIHNLEAVFSAFEMGKLIEKLGNFTPGQLATFPEMYKVLIGSTIELSQRFRISTTTHKFLPPRSYSVFVEELIKKKFLEKNVLDQVSIVSFNYDVGLDHALYYHGVPYDYCINNTRHNTLKLLKLHGSVNWATTSGNDIYPWDMNDLLGRFNWSSYGAGAVHLPVVSNLNLFQPKFGLSVQRYPVIVPPTWNKTDYHSSIANVWKTAAKELHDAEHIFVLGYSLPTTDQFFHLLFALGTESPTVIRKFWVLNPDEQVSQRFQEKLGHHLKERYSFFGQKFSDSIATIQEGI